MKTLAKEFGLLRADKAGPTYSLNTISAEGWELIDPASGLFANRTYFDLAGMSMDDKTLFFTGATMQDTLNPSANPSLPGSLAIMADVMSNKPLSNTDIAGVIALGNLPGTGGAQLTFDQTIYMRLRTWNIDLDNAAGGYFIKLADNQLGSLSPTASDRIYCTRVVLFAATNPDGVYGAWPVRYILQANAKEEPEYEYLMRLKRSYELQNEPDRD